MRLQLPLSSDWRFFPDFDRPATLDPADHDRPNGDGSPVLVPGYWQLQFPTLTRATGAVWYRVRFDLDSRWSKCDSTHVCFGAAGHYTQGWLNGVYLGSHDGAHTPFSWPLDGAVRIGANELWVRCVTPSSDRSRYPDFPFDETLHGKQSWYGPNGGIWQPVTLEGRHRHAIDHLSVTANPAASALELSIDFDETPTESSDVTALIEVRDPAGETVVDAVVDAADLTRPAGVEVKLTTAMQMWSLAEPNLYNVCATVYVAGEPVDQVSKTTGFRTFGSDKEGRFLLNGHPILMRGVLDQDYHDGAGVPAYHPVPGGSGSSMTTAGLAANRQQAKQQLIDRFCEVKAMGFNTLRCHIKIPDPIYLEAADEVGLIVWCELPSTTRLNEHSLIRMTETLEKVVRRDNHHPSLMIWSVINESWGFDLTDNPTHRQTLVDLVRRLRKLDPQRLVVDNSPCEPNFHIETDIDDYHFYALMPEMRHRWDQFIDAFSGRPGFTFSPHGDGQRSGTEPLVVSEFGTWGLPELSWVDHDNEPWWFETGQEWAGGAAYVHGYRERFALWHLSGVFRTWANLSRQTQRRQFDSMRYQVDSMRLRPALAGYVLTELTDVHWEANGLFDMRGVPRRFANELASLNSAIRIVVGHGFSTAQSGEQLSLPLAVSCHDTTAGDLDAEIRWSDGNGSEGRIDLGPLVSGELCSVEPLEIKTPEVDRPTTMTVRADLIVRSPDGRAGSLNTDERTILVIPRSGPEPGNRVVATRNETLADLLTGLGYRPEPIGTSHDQLRIVDRLTDDDHRFIRSGGRALLLAADEGSLGRGFADFPRISLRKWQDALFDGGHWVSAFPWLKRSGRLAALPGDAMMDMAFDGIAPQLVISGVPPARYESAVYAGVFVGWIHQMAALLVRHDVGLGSVLVNTLELTGERARELPISRWLLHQLIAMARE